MQPSHPQFPLFSLVPRSTERSIPPGRLTRSVRWTALLTPALAACVHARSPWTPVVVSPTTSYSVRFDTIARPTPGTLIVWVRREYKPDSPLHHLGLGSAVNREDVDCAHKREKLLTSTVYDRSGDSVSSRTYSDQQWHQPRHGSDAEVVLSEICARAAKTP